jgi:hypothetical protein
MKINVQRVVDYNCERGRSAKSVKRLEVTLAAYRCHCTLSTVEGLKSFGERGRMANMDTMIAWGLLKRRFYEVVQGDRRCARERLRWVKRRVV